MTVETRLPGPPPAHLFVYGSLVDPRCPQPSGQTEWHRTAKPLIPLLVTPRAVSAGHAGIDGQSSHAIRMDMNTRGEEGMPVTVH